MKPSVAVIHGLFMNELVMKPLAKRISKKGFSTKTLGYSSFSFDTEALFIKLDNFFKEKGEVYIVAWSLGGIVARQYLERGSKESHNVKCVITLGTPHQGSSAAQKIFGKIPELFHPNAIEPLLRTYDAWELKTPLHSIAGSTHNGWRDLPLVKNSDSLVTIEETRIKGMSSHDTFNTNHSGLILSKKVANKVCEILIEHTTQKRPLTIYS